MNTKFLLSLALVATTVTSTFFTKNAEARPGSWNFDGVFDSVFNSDPPLNEDWLDRRYQLNLFSPSGFMEDAWVTYFDIDARSGFIQYRNRTDFIDPFLTPTLDFDDSLRWELDVKDYGFDFPGSYDYVIKIYNHNDFGNLKISINEPIVTCLGCPSYASGIDNNPQIKATPEPSQIGSLFILGGMGLLASLKRFYRSKVKLIN